MPMAWEFGSGTFARQLHGPLCDPGVAGMEAITATGRQKLDNRQVQRGQIDQASGALVLFKAGRKESVA